MKKTLGETQKAEINCLLRNTRCAMLKSLSNHRILSVEPYGPPLKNCSISKRSRSHGCEIEKSLNVLEFATNASSDFATAISGVDHVIDNKQLYCTTKNNSSKIPIPIKQQPGCTKRKKLSVIKPNSRKTILQNFRYVAAKPFQNELVLKASSSPQIRSLEMQFQCKKEKIDQLQNEIYVKQKAVSEIHQHLVELKGKLKICGKEIPLSNLNLLNCGDGWEKHKSNKIAPETNEEFKMNSEMVQNMNTTMQQICKFLMIKRLELVEVLEKMSNKPMNRKKLQQTIQSLKGENLEKSDVRNSKKSDYYLSFAKQIKLLQEKLNNKELKLAKVANDLKQAQEKNKENSAVYEKIINELKEQLKQMEDEINQSKIIPQNCNGKNEFYDQHIVMSLQKRIKETEAKLRKAESKCCELQKAIRY